MLFPRYFRLFDLRQADLFDGCLFLYFATLHADQLNIVMSAYTIRLNTLLACLLGSALLMHIKGKLVISTHLLRGLGVVFVSLFLSFLFSPYKSRCFFFLGWYVATIACYVLLPYLLVYNRNYQKIFRCYVASFFFVGICASIQWILSLCGFLAPFAAQMIKGTLVRPNAFSYEPSFYALYMTPFMIMMQLHYQLQKEGSSSVFPRISRKTLVTIHCFYLLSTATTTLFAYAFFLVTLVGVYLMTRWKRDIPFFRNTILRTGAFLFLVLTIASLCFPMIARQYYLKFFLGDFRTHHSFAERWVGILNAWHVMRDHVWVGVGLGGIPSYLFDAWSRGDMSYLFLSQEGLMTDTSRHLKLFEPSNVCTEVLGSLGIIGVIAFGWLIGSYITLVNRARRSLTKESGAKKEVFILFISVIVSLLVLQFNQGLFRPYIWVHFTLAFAFTEKMIVDSKNNFSNIRLSLKEDFF